MEIQILNEDMIVEVVILQFKQLQINQKIYFGTSTGFEPIASVLVLWCSTILCRLLVSAVTRPQLFKRCSRLYFYKNENNNLFEKVTNKVMQH